MANGQRFETYIIPDDAGRGEIILNGATTHLGQRGDRLTIMTFTALPKQEALGWQPSMVVLDEENRGIARRPS